MLRDVKRVAPRLEPLSLDGIELKEAAYRVLRHPAVADKTFLIAIGDRTRRRPVLARSRSSAPGRCRWPIAR